jgi:hypothetical protein
MIDGFHGEGEFTNDPVKIHDPQATALDGRSDISGAL